MADHPLYIPGDPIPFTHHPNYADILKAVRSLIHLTASWKGIAYRSVKPCYSSPRDFFSGEGAALAGGRWNPPGIHTVYLSTDPATTMDEALASNRAFGIPDHDALPLTTEAARIAVKRALNLGDVAIRAALNVPLDQLLVEDFRIASLNRREARCQALGRAFYAVGIQALIIPSRLNPNANNLAIFCTLLDPAAGDYCQAIHPDQLPPG